MGRGRVNDTELMLRLVVGYTELRGSKLKKWKRFSKPNFGLLPKSSQASDSIYESLTCHLQDFLGIFTLVAECRVFSFVTAMWFALDRGARLRRPLRGFSSRMPVALFRCVLARSLP